MSDPFIGQIQAFGFNYPPRNWAFCNGALLTIAQNSTLYALIGANYGGDARTNFGLPNLTSRTPVGFNMGNSTGLTPFPIGASAGAQQHLLQIHEMPTHTHAATFIPTGTSSPASVEATTEDGDASAPSNGAFLAQPSELSGPDTREEIYKSNPSPASLVTLGGVSGGGGSAGGVVSVSNAGGNNAFGILNPFLAVNFSIALLGIFPPRN